MRVPKALVEKLRRDYRDERELWRLADAAGMPGTEQQYARMWMGDFDGVELKTAEGFFFMVGYTLNLKRASNEG